MSFDISYIFTAVDEFSKVSREIGRSVGALVKKIAGLGKKIHGVGASMTRLGKGMMLKVTAPILAGGAAVLKASNDMENFRNRLADVGLTAAQQKEAYRKLTDFIVNSPFPAESVENGAIALLTMSHNTNKTISTLKMLGDISAQTKADIGMLAGAVGRVAATPRGLTTMVSTFGQYGIKLTDTWKKMAIEAGHAAIATDEGMQKAIAAHIITMPVILDTFKIMTTGTGKFAGAMDRLSNELGPLLGSFYFDLKAKLLAPIGDSVVESLHLKVALNAAIQYLLDNQDKIKLWLDTHKELIKIIVLVTVFAALLAPILIMLGLMAMAIGALLSPVSLVIMAIGLIAAIIIKNKVATEGWAKTIQDLIGFAHGLWVIFKDVFNILYDAYVIVKDIIKFLMHPFSLAKNIKLLFSLPKELKGLTFRHMFEAPKGVMDMLKNFSLPEMTEGEGGGILSRLLSSGKESEESILTRQSLTSQPISKLEISVKDPSGIIKSVKGEGDHEMDMKVGTNMAHAI